MFKQKYIKKIEVEKKDKDMDTMDIAMLVFVKGWQSYQWIVITNKLAMFHIGH